MVYECMHAWDAPWNTPCTPCMVPLPKDPCLRRWVALSRQRVKPLLSMRWLRRIRALGRAGYLARRLDKTPSHDQREGFYDGFCYVGRADYYQQVHMNTRMFISISA